MLFNAVLGLLQEGRAQATIAALKSRLALNASVLRDGVWTVLPVAALVPGDVIKLTLGGVVAADVRNGQAIFYVVRERRHIWSSRPSLAVVLCSIADALIIPSLAVAGILMAPLPVSIVLSVFCASIILAFVLDQVKVFLFGRLKMT